MPRRPRERQRRASREPEREPELPLGEARDLPLPETRMSGAGPAALMSETTPGEPMPGLATPEQLQQLRDAEGVEAERIFLELMIAHHQGGVEMASAVIERSEHPVVVDLAAGMVRAQQSEVDYMTELLEARS